jgi:outer membrane protein TolC
MTAYLQLGIMVLFATGCTPTQPFFYNESPDLQHYLNSATAIEYPDVEVESLAETTEALPPLTLGNHDYQFWDVTVEECVAIALQNARFFPTTSGNAEFRQSIATQFSSANVDQFGSIYDVAISQSTTQSVPLTVDSNGNRVLPRGVLRANQIGGVEDALTEFDAQASGFFNYSTTDRPRNTGSLNTVNPQFFKATDTTQQSAISKRFATGGVGTLRQQIVYSRNNTQISNIARAVPSDWTAVLEAQIQHPLMRNRGTLVNRIPVVLASLNEDDSIADFEIIVRNLVRDVEVAYWNLYVAYRAVSTGIIGRNSAIATAKFAQLNLDNGVGTKQEVAQANEQYYNFRARLQAALAGSNLLGDERQGVYGSERALRELLGLAATDGRLIRPIQEPSLARLEFDWDESVAQMLYLSPELRKGRIVIKQRELEQMSAKNQLLPEVNLSLLYRWVGVGDTLGPPTRRDVNFPAPGSSALGELTEGNYQEGAIRLEITPPAFGGRRERARIRNSQLRLQQIHAFLQDAERLLVSQLSDAVAKTTTHYALVQSHAQRWQAAEQEVEARLAQYRFGQSQVNVVLQSQQRRADAQISYYRALAEYNKSINYVDYLKGTMLANSNITMAEGPWNKKAYWDALERARERSAGRKLQYGVSRPGVIRRGPLADADAAATDLLGLNLQPDREAIDVNSVPLREMGSTSGEMLGPEVPQPRPATPEALPLPLPDSVPLPTPDGARSAPPPNDVNQTVDTVNYVTDVEISNAPQPVRRTPIPSR